MQRRKFAREFKLEAVRLVRERGVTIAQAARDLDLHKNVLRKWVKEFVADPGHAFPGHGQMRPEQMMIRGIIVAPNAGGVDVLSARCFAKRLSCLAQPGTVAARLRR